MIEEIILYSSSECVRCKLVKQMLDVHNVSYMELKDQKELAIEKEIEEYPSIEINGKVINGYSSVLTWLRNNGWYSLWEDNKDESNKA